MKTPLPFAALPLVAGLAASSSVSAEPLSIVGKSLDVHADNQTPDLPSEVALAAVDISIAANARIGGVCGLKTFVLDNPDSPEVLKAPVSGERTPDAWLVSAYLSNEDMMVAWPLDSQADLDCANRESLRFSAFEDKDWLAVCFGWVDVVRPEVRNGSVPSKGFGLLTSHCTFARKSDLPVEKIK